MKEGGLQKIIEKRFETIVEAIEPTQEQKPLIENLRTAINSASTMVTKDGKLFSINGESTPSEKLAGIEQGLEGALLAVREVRPSFDALYASLSEKQKTTLEDMRPKRGFHGGRPHWKSEKPE